MVSQLAFSYFSIPLLFTLSFLLNLLNTIDYCKNITGDLQPKEDYDNHNYTISFYFCLISSLNTSLNCAQQSDETKRRTQAIVSLVESFQNFPTDEIERFTAELNKQQFLNQWPASEQWKVEVICFHQPSQDMLKENLRK